MAVAAEVLHRIDPDLTPPRSVRSSGETPRRVRVPAAGLVERVAELAAAEDAVLAAETGTDGGDTGRLAVLAPAGLAADVAAAVIAKVPDAGFGPDPDLERRTVVLPVRQAKGLEFDTVLVVEPDGIAAADPHGENDLYVALTRATRRLVIVESED
jgi:superfamily I DNA/RNA helicase